jgi:hypothetical protein
MKTRRIEKPETRGYCHDCHNRAALEVTFAHRDPIRLCARCAGFMIEQVSEVARAIKRNGKNGKNHRTKTPAGG